MVRADVFPSISPVRRRLVAAAVDAVVVVAILGAIGTPATVLLGGATVTPWLLAAALVTAFVTPPVYLVVGEGRFGTTIGKRLVGLRVTRVSGERLGVGRACLRLLFRLSPVAWWGFAVDSPSAGSPSWHDRWAGSEVRHAADHPAALHASPITTGPHGESPEILRQVGDTVRSRPVQPVRSNSSARSRNCDRPVRSEARILRTALPLKTMHRPCMCNTMRRVEGAAALDYAIGHLYALARYPDEGRAALVCVETRTAWMAHDGSASRDDGPFLVRVAELPPALASLTPGNTSL